MSENPSPAQVLCTQHVHIVLVQTLAAGNIGSAARAMKNMGFSSLRLVAPQCSLEEPELFWMAHGAEEVVHQAAVYPCLSAAVADCSVLVGTSHKPRRHSRWCVAPRELGPRLAQISQRNHIAVVFGREDHGLSNAQLDQCHWTLNIPAASSHPALNLSQAVMLVCYELFLASAPAGGRPLPCFVSNAVLEPLLERLQAVIEAAGFQHKNGRPQTFMSALRRVLGRAGLDAHDLQVLHKLCDQFSYLAGLKTHQEDAAQVDKDS